MKFFLIIFMPFSMLIFSQNHKQISTIDFVQILDQNKTEALFYYQHNWMQLRKEAVKRGYIHSYQLLEAEATEEAPFHLILITTYKNNNQFEQRETHFQGLIKEQGGLKLLNEKTPPEFRKTLFSKNNVIHLED